MIEDQKYILTQILDIIDEEQPDAVLIAGDVYDKSIASAEAIGLFDDFLVHLAVRHMQVFIISGNHDSSERLAFGGRLMDASGIHFAPVYHGSVTPLTLKDDFGSVNIYMLPFIKPANVRGFFPEETIDNYDDAVRTVISAMNLSADERNILMAHQFVTGAQRSESEDVAVGGLDNIDASMLDVFDYVALGHIHGPQNIDSEKVRYCGTPLKYSFSEIAHEKSVTVVELREKGKLSVRTVPLKPLHDMRELRGTYADLVRKDFYEGTTYAEDYVHIILTDEDDIPDAMSKLRVVYHNLMKLDYDNKRTRHKAEINGAADVEMKTPLELFSEFYLQQNGSAMSPEQVEIIRAAVEKIWEDKE